MKIIAEALVFKTFLKSAQQFDIGHLLLIIWVDICELEVVEVKKRGPPCHVLASDDLKA